MLSLSSAHRYYLYREPADFRKSFDGLAGLVTNHMKRSPMSGEVFLFLNPEYSGEQIRLLVWDRSGFVLYCKRLERGTFERPLEGVPLGKESAGAPCGAVSWGELQLILEGVSLSSAQWRKRYEHGGQAAVPQTEKTAAYPQQSAENSG
jgi:transposase